MDQKKQKKVWPLWLSHSQNKLKTTMTTQHKLPLLALILIGAFFAWAFNDPYAFKLDEEPPGTINVTGIAGSPKVFEFKKWKINKFDWQQDDFETINIEVLIDCKSLSHEWKDLEKNIKKKKDYFYVKKFPTAMAKVTGASRNEDGSYSAIMELSLKGVVREVPIQFEVVSSAPFRVVGQGELNRRNFKFNGGGPQDIVPLNFDITLPQETI